MKAALVNGAKPINSLAGPVYTVSAFGAGRVAVDRSIDLPVTAASDPSAGAVAVSFGALVAAEPIQTKKSFYVKNHGAVAAKLDLAIELTHPLPGVTVTATPTSLDIAAGQSARVELELAFDPKVFGDANPGADPTTAATQYGQPRHFLNEASGVVRLTSQSPAFDLAVPFLGSVRAAAHRKAAPAKPCGTPSGSHAIEITGASATHQPVVSAFRLASLEPADDPVNPATAMLDLRAVGVATNYATADSFDKASVYLAVAVNGDWTTTARPPARTRPTLVAR